ncbi:phage tail protein [Mesorhizobium sp. NBSH29]|uniref:phage tail protein n=1 Tax=Mesorhizobium sp. NBSH29 TaxID=2654249 RepID=UPI00215654D9|nr:phage tail protein [Mesorhizobium sp. NBSH29]
MTRTHLLPLNATPIDRAVSEAIDRSPELAMGADHVRGFKFNPSPAVIPHLIVEYGLAEIEDFVTEEILRAGVAWQRIRGTPASIHMALRWINSDGVIEENPVTRFKWWWFQVHMPDARRSSSFVTPMITLGKASKPLRSEFARITAGYDIRALRLNAGRLNANLLNSWSGMRRAEDEPVLSFRYHHMAPAPENEIYELSLAAKKSVRHVYLTDAAAATEQKSGFPSSLGTRPFDWSDPVSVPFNNAPFNDEPFGVPNPYVQTGN